MAGLKKLKKVGCLNFYKLLSFVKLLLAVQEKMSFKLLTPAAGSILTPGA